VKEVSNPLGFWPVLAGSTFLSTPGVKGLIIEDKTGKPLAGAHVYALWKRHLRGFRGQITEETAKKTGMVTSEDGCFEIPPYFLFNPSPDLRGHAGSFAFMVYAEGYKARLYTFSDPESLTSYPYDWKEVAPSSNGERMTIRLSRISDSVTELPGPASESGSGPGKSRPEGARVPVGPGNGQSADGRYAAEDCEAAAELPDGPSDESNIQRGHINERIMRARKRLTEESKNLMKTD